MKVACLSVGLGVLFVLVALFICAFVDEDTAPFSKTSTNHVSVYVQTRVPVWLKKPRCGSSRLPDKQWNASLQRHVWFCIPRKGRMVMVKYHNRYLYLLYRYINKPGDLP